MYERERRRFHIGETSSQSPEPLSPVDQHHSLQTLDRSYTHAHKVRDCPIVDMELWDSDAIDLLGPGFLEFRPDDDGEFRFIAVHGFIDVRYGEVDGMLRAEFSWEGDDDGSPTSGRGWVTLVAAGTIEGRIFFHMGDVSSFRAIPMGS